jgi:hypothetical protein
MQVLWLTMCVPAALSAQWRLAITAGSSTVRGDARNDADADHPELRDDRPSTIRLAVGRDAGAWRVMAGLERTGADIAEASAATAIVTPDALHAWGASLEVGRRLLGHPEAARLYLLAGGQLARWTFDEVDASTRTRAAIQGAAEFDFPVGSRWSAVVRGELGTGESTFSADELPAGFAPVSRRRSGVSLGVAREW